MRKQIVEILHCHGIHNPTLQPEFVDVSFKSFCEEGFIFLKKTPFLYIHTLLCRVYCCHVCLIQADYDFENKILWYIDQVPILFRISIYIYIIFTYFVLQLKTSQIHWAYPIPQPHVLLIPVSFSRFFLTCNFCCNIIFGKLNKSEPITVGLCSGGGSCVPDCR